jgi:hypothetical protein
MAAQDLRSADAHPTKEFFVKMLTRDIALEDTILDLIDNCLDGVLRTIGAVAKSSGERPYAKFRAKISITDGTFVIEDNCGGMTLKTLEEDAFRLGRPPNPRDKDLGTVGVYGIGMKRAIFKMGSSANVRTRHDTSEYEVRIPANWVGNEHWAFEIERVRTPSLPSAGTRITITDLHADIRAAFANPDFLNRLQELIRQTYSIIMRKGFSIFFGEAKLKPDEVRIYVSDRDDAISCYALQGVIDNVGVTISCGFYRPLSRETEQEEDEKSKTRQSLAGWTVICNDRVVLSQDRTALTGWGTSRVPSFHNQFNSFCGTIEFEAPDASLLPLTTTKRGVDGGSSVYIKAREYMTRGTKIFTTFTNKWKGDEEKTEQFFKRASEAPATDAYKTVRNSMREVQNSRGLLRQWIPDLPMPPDTGVPMRRIAFKKAVSDIEKVSTWLFDRIEDASVVGEKCFDDVLERLGR